MQRPWGVLCVALAVVATSSAARAQSMPPPEAGAPERTSVLQRARPDYDALGVRLGSFVLLPSVDLSETYNSNVFVTPSPTVADFFTTLSSAIGLSSDWNRHQLGFGIGGNIQRYAQAVSENVSNAAAAIGGRLDILNGIYLTGDLSYQLQHEPRTSPDTVTNQKNPIEYQQATASLDFVHDTGRLALTAIGEIDDYAYNNGVSITGTVIPETPRNYMLYRVAPRLAYEIAPGYHAFIQTPLNARQYQAQIGLNGFGNNSHGYEVDAGTALSLGGLLNGEGFVGYLEQDYEDHRLPLDSSVAFGGNLLLNVTQLTSIRGSVSRTIQETTIVGASGVRATSAALSVEHELLRNVLLSGSVSYLNQAFVDTTRVDGTYGAGVGARYLLNRDVYTGINLSYSKRNSNATPPAGYTQEMVAVDLHLQF